MGYTQSFPTVSLAVEKMEVSISEIDLLKSHPLKGMGWGPSLPMFWNPCIYHTAF